MRTSLLCSLTFTLLTLSAPTNAAENFPLKDGDIWVMAGDSITAQHLHSNYFEAFCFARYPEMKFAFRNSGVGGHTIPSTLARFDYDIGAWNPTVVSVELGMNDKGGTPTKKFVENMGGMVARIKGIKARPIIFSASPINNGDTLAKLGGNKSLADYADALKEYCAAEKIPYADQFHALVDLWGKNKPNENLITTLATIRNLADNDKLEGVDHLRQFLVLHEKDAAALVAMQGDAVHPGAPGQLMMAAALLKELGAKGFVSSVSIDMKSGGKSEVKGCAVSEVKAEDGKLAFDRLDECLPFPIPDDAGRVIALYPVILDLSQYDLQVTGLKEGNYQLKINGINSATLTAKELEAGINLTSLGALPKAKDVSPIIAQSRAILAAVNAKEGVVGQWRGLSAKAHVKDAAPELKTQLAELTKKVEAADALIRQAAKPQKLHFELVPVQ